MERPATKKELIKSSQTLYLDIMKWVNACPVQLKNKTFKIRKRDKNVRDVIYHLYGWHELMLEWFIIHAEGGRPILPKRGHTWDRLDILNDEIHDAGQVYTLDHTLAIFDESHRKMMALIEGLSDEEITTPGHFNWAGKAPLIHLIDAIMCDHYIWGLKALKELEKS